MQRLYQCVTAAEAVKCVTRWHAHRAGDNRVDDAELRYLLVGPTSDMLEKGPMIPAEWVRYLEI